MLCEYPSLALLFSRSVVHHAQLFFDFPKAEAKKIVRERLYITSAAYVHLS